MPQLSAACLADNPLPHTSLSTFLIFRIDILLFFAIAAPSTVFRRSVMTINRNYPASLGAPGVADQFCNWWPTIIVMPGRLLLQRVAD
jgi:hypothetical protein